MTKAICSRFSQVWLRGIPQCLEMLNHVSFFTVYTQPRGCLLLAWAGDLEVAQIRGSLWSLVTTLWVVRKALISHHIKSLVKGVQDRSGP